MPTLMTDPRSGGVKKTSGVKILPLVAETWAEVRNEMNPTIDWLIAGYNLSSRTDITVLEKGSGGISNCASALPDNKPVFGGCKLATGRFVTFYHVPDSVSVMDKGRASMHKNGVLNVLEGSDREIKMEPNLKEAEALLQNASSISLVSHPTEHSCNSIPVLPNVSQIKKESKLEYPTEVSLIKTVPITDPIVETTNSNNEVIMDTLDKTLNNAFVSYSDIKDVKDPNCLPFGVDASNREMSLSDSEFQEVFGMDKQTFVGLPKWKRTNRKKEKHLF